jgi:hypothetical protein
LLIFTYSFTIYSLLKTALNNDWLRSSTVGWYGSERLNSILFVFSYIAIGLLLIALPFIITNYYYHYMLFYALWSIGVLLVLNGIIYKTTVKLSKKKKDAFENRKGLPKTNGEILGYIGLIIFFTSSGLGLISTYVGGTTSFVALFWLLMVAGIIMVFISIL